MTRLTMLGLVLGVAAIALATWAILRIAKRLRRFLLRSEARPNTASVASSLLKSMLLSLNQDRHPFTIRVGNDCDLEVEWKIVDAEWMEILGQAWARKTYRAWIRLDEAARTVKLCECLVETGLQLGGPTAWSQSSSFQGLEIWGKHHDCRWGIRDDFTVREIYDYRFSPNDIKSVIRQIANDHGWAFELALTKRQVCRPKTSVVPAA